MLLSRPLDGLRTRIALIVALHVAILLCLLLLVSTRLEERPQPFFQLVPPEDVAAMVRAVEESPDSSRNAVLTGLSTGGTASFLLSDFPGEERYATRLLGDRMDRYRDVLPGHAIRVQVEGKASLRDLGGGRTFSSQPIRILVALRGGQILAIERTAPPAVTHFFGHFSYFVGGVLIAGLVTVSLVAAQTTGPIAELVKTLESQGGDLSAPDLALIGPREIRVLAKVFNDMRRRLKGLVEERTGMLAAVAHDYRTYLTRLELRTDHIENARQRLLARADLAEMSKLLDDTLNFARLTARVDAVEPGQADVARLIRECAAKRAETEDIRVSSDLPRSLRAGVGPITMNRMLDNLIGNALRYGGSASITALQRHGRVLVCVEDDGPGVPDVRLEELTRPFFRLENSRGRDTGGAGLGLAIVKALAETNGGTLTLANRSGGGFSARIDLPAA